MNFVQAQKVADAILYEGYVLYPYRASAAKNQVRWQFGVVVPRGYSEAEGSEPWGMQTECLIEPGTLPVLDLRIRFLQVQARRIEEAVNASGDTFRAVATLEVERQQLVTWDEGIVRECDFPGLRLSEILGTEQVMPLELAGGQESELVRDAAGTIVGRMTHERWPIAGVVRITAETRGIVVKLRVRIENLGPWPGAAQAGRDHALRHSLVSTHTLLAIHDGTFVSLLDPPEWARSAAASCRNLHTWPVLIGTGEQRDVMLSSPIILYDYPQIAPESPGDLCDATEIDEILTLRTMTLTEEEKREARGTDARAAAIIDQVDAMPPELLERLHGAVRYLRAATEKGSPESQEVPWWDPAADATVSPATDSIRIGTVSVAKGSRVRLCPGRRRADAQDMFLVGRLATVEGVFFDVENNSYLAVTLIDDPAADLFQGHGRFLYFSPDEVEPLDHEERRDVLCKNEGNSGRSIES